MKRVVAVLLLGLVGCAKEPRAKQDPPQEVVAKVGERVFTVKDVEGQLQAQPEFVRARYATPERKREFVESLVKTELLVQEARRRELEKRPEVQAMLDRMLVQQLVAEASKQQEPGELEARKYYEEHLSDFARPERVQVAVIEFGARPAGGRPSAAEVEKELAQLRRAKPADQKRAFSALVLARSTHEASRSLDGDVGPRTHEELAQQFSAQVADAAFALQAPGQLSAPTESGRGLVVARLLGRQAGETRSFESEKAHILAKLTAEARGKQLEVLVSSAREKTPVVIDDAMVSRVDAKVPTGPLLPP